MACSSEARRRRSAPAPSSSGAKARAFSTRPSSARRRRSTGSSPSERKRTPTPSSPCATRSSCSGTPSAKCSTRSARRHPSRPATPPGWRYIGIRASSVTAPPTGGMTERRSSRSASWRRRARRRLPRSPLWAPALLAPTKVSPSGTIPSRRTNRAPLPTPDKSPSWPKTASGRSRPAHRRRTSRIGASTAGASIPTRRSTTTSARRLSPRPR